MKKQTSSTTVILFAFIANLVIAILKFLVAFFTLSSAMLAEAIHSVADTLNQVFLLIGIKRGRREPDAIHPFGFSSELYFWSFIVAIMLFTLGAFFSIFKGIQKLIHPVEIEHVGYAFMVLIFAIIGESIAFYKAFQKINRERGKINIINYLRRTKKSELIVVFLEDLAAISGLLIALVMIFLHQVTGILIFDGIASVCIGLILAVVAVFLGNEIKSLLIGESADPKVIKGIMDILNKEESLSSVIYVKSLQFGPDDVLLAVKAEFNHRLTAIEISNLINGIERDIRKKYPMMKKIFIEPDIYKPLE
jgi:cation diffusion facilitator family transporter